MATEETSPARFHFHAKSTSLPVLNIRSKAQIEGKRLVETVEGSYLQLKPVNRIPLLGQTVVGLMTDIRKNRQSLVTLPCKEGTLSPTKLVGITEQLMKFHSRSRDKIQTFVDQKRALFYMALKTQERNKQIAYFQRKSKEQENAILQMESKMLEDLDRFEQYMDKDRNLTKMQMKETEECLREKAAICAKLKELNEKKTTKVNAIGKLVEKLQQLYQYKEFMDAILPKKNVPKLTPELPILTVQNSDGKRPQNLRKISKNELLKTQESRNRNNTNQSIEDETRRRPGDGNFAENKKQNADRKENRGGRVSHLKIPLSDIKLENCGTLSSQTSGLTFHNEREKEDVRAALDKIKKTAPNLSSEFNQFFEATKPEPVEFGQTDILSQFMKDMEEENLSLISKIQNTKAAINKRENFLTNCRQEQANVLEQLQKKRAELLGQSRKREDTCFRMQEADSIQSTRTSKMLEELERAVQQLCHPLGIKKGKSPLELLKDLEAKLIDKIKRIETLDQAAIKKLMRGLAEENKMMAKTAEIIAGPKTPKTEELPEIPTQKQYRPRPASRHVNRRSFIKRSQPTSHDDTALTQEVMEEKLYFS